MVVNRVLALGCLACALAGAQTFPPEFRTDDGMVRSRILSLLERMGDQDTALSRVFDRLVALPASRVYRQMDEQARAAALRSALPLVKAVAMSEAVQKAQDEQIARQFGAVDHGLKLPYRANPRKRFEELSRQMQKNPAAMQNPRFMEEFMKAQNEMASAGVEEAFDVKLTLFTKPLAEVKQEFQNDRQASGSMENARKCYDEAAPLADSAPDRFRLLAFRCAMLVYGMDKSESEADRIRKERAQRLYDEKSVKGAIRKTLTQFLETASTVDFAAQTAAKGGRQVFVNPEYEKKDGLWKLIYRNGKEPTEVTVQFAKGWLAEIQPLAPAPAAAPSAANPAGGGARKAAPGKAAPKK